MKLSILIPTIDSRKHFLNRLLNELNYQISICSEPGQVEIKVLYGTESTGVKRNTLMEMANGLCLAQFDDDDMPGPTYIQKGIDFANSGKDCASLIGLYFLNGVYDRPFLHSIKYKKWWQDDRFYYRCNNHLNYYRTEIARQVKYQDKTVGEDGNWSYDIRDSGLLKAEYEIKETLYLYYARTKNPLE